MNLMGLPPINYKHHPTPINSMPPPINSKPLSPPSSSLIQFKQESFTFPSGAVNNTFVNFVQFIFTLQTQFGFLKNFTKF